MPIVLNPTQYQVFKELKYNPFTGIFTRRNTGERACRTDMTKGYLRVYCLGKYYKAHRLAWYYVHAKWPSEQIDHVDGDKQNNVISNLRDVDQTTNMYNQSKAHKQNTTGYIGVGKSRNKFVAKIRINAKLVHLGTFNTPEEAHRRYTEYKSTLDSRT
jgi:HNH endonuclease